MPAPIDPDKRAAIEQAIRDGAGTRSRASIAREHDVAASTVGKIATEAGIDDAFDRTKTKNATRAHAVDMAAERSVQARGFLEDVAFLRSLLRQEWTKTVVLPDPAGASTVQVEADSVEIAAGLQRLMTAAGIAMDKHLAVEKHHAKDDTGAAAVDSWLMHLLGQG